MPITLGRCLAISVIHHTFSISLVGVNDRSLQDHSLPVDLMCDSAG